MSKKTSNNTIVKDSKPKVNTTYKGLELESLRWPDYYAMWGQVSEKYIETLCRDINKWAIWTYENPELAQAFSVEDFYIIMRIPHKTAWQWVQKYPSFAFAAEEANKVLGAMRFKLVTHTYKDSSMIKTTQYQHSGAYREAEERKATLNAKSGNPGFQGTLTMNDITSDGTKKDS